MLIYQRVIICLNEIEGENVWDLTDELMEF